jgi:exosortase
MFTRNVLFTIYSVTVFLLFYASLKDLLGTPLTNDYYSHIVCVPLISAYLLYTKKKALFSRREYSILSGFALIIAGLCILAISRNGRDQFTAVSTLFLTSLSAITFWIGGLALCYGINALRIAAGPLLFLIFTMPVPSAVMKKIIFLLQSGSSAAAEVIFRLTGVPYVRDGFTFNLPKLSIEVAQQCSGIHSTIALLVTGWRRIILILSILPISIIKNGLRISVLSIGGVYIDESILRDSWLHRSGGILFFLIALSLMMLVLRMLKYTERTNSSEMQRYTTIRSGESDLKCTDCSKS